MRKNMPSNGLSSIGTSKQRTRTRIRLDLVDEQSGQIELLRHLSNLAQMLIESLLAIVELTTANVVRPEIRHDAVDDEEAELAGREVLG
jgi:hypothetical protein